MSGSNRDHWPDDETLVAYADGTLPAAQAEKVAIFLAENSEARRFVELLQQSGEIAKGAYDEALEQAQSDAKLEALILGGASGSAENTVVALPVRPTRTSVLPRLALPMAAAIALIVGGIAGYEIGRQGDGLNPIDNQDVAVGPVRPGTALADLLDNKPSGDALTMPGPQPRDLMVIASFRDAKGRICREFEILAAEPSGSLTVGIACRNDAGRWRVEGATQLAKTPQPSAQDFSPASGDDAAAIEGMLKAIGARPALSKAEEEAMLNTKWE